MWLGESGRTVFLSGPDLEQELDNLPAHIHVKMQGSGLIAGCTMPSSDPLGPLIDSANADGIL